MLKKVLLGVVAVVVAFLAFVAAKDGAFSITRSAVLKAPPEVVFAQVVDFKNWAAWSPWEKLDPKAQKTFGGTPGAVGSSYAWQGNSDMGSGKMTVAKLDAPKSLDIDLEFTTPMAARNPTHFEFAAAPEGTKVTWTMSGTNGFMGKLFTTFMNMDKMVGTSFEQGLAALDTVAQGEAKKAAEAKAKADAEAAAAASAAAAGAAPVAPAAP